MSYFDFDYFNIDPHFGTNQDLRVMISMVYERKMYVFLDGIFWYHGSVQRMSPSGFIPFGPSKNVTYPESLDFYREVFTNTQKCLLSAFDLQGY